MKIKITMVMSALGEEYILVPVGGSESSFHGLIRLNETGAEIWKGISQGLDEKQIVSRLLAEYDGVDEETARRAVRKIIDQLKAEGILEE